jgi:malate dehydrogenase (oxaloacetate-decarboxylating)(NADP+)
MTRLPGGLHLRRAMPADAAALAAFAAQTFIDAFGPENDPANVAAYVSQVYGEAQQAREIADPNTITLLAEGPHGLAAYAQVRRTTPPACVTAPHAVELHRIYLHRDWQGRTLAQRLMIAVHHAARELGGQYLYLGVWEKNARAIAFYERQGFHQVGDVPFKLGDEAQRDLILQMPVRRLERSQRLTGVDLLQNPYLNKGSAFSEAERTTYGLRGMLPYRVLTIEQQVERALVNLRRKPTPLEKYVYLAGLRGRNVTLYYRVLVDHITEVMPVVYTPTVGEACQQFGEIFGRPRGLYVTPDDRGRIAEMLRAWHRDDIGVIVVTDGERILGLGDLGAQGMGIPIGKLSLYTACAGIDPSRCLPVCLDVGTDNEVLRNTPFYPGMPVPRVRGEAYEALVDEFVHAVRTVFPHALLQWEDFATENAFHLLARHRKRIRSFNDDIQGTAAVTLAGLYSAVRITGGTIADQTVLFYGAGAAATGIGELIVTAMREAGLDEAEARRRCWFLDSKGLVVASRTDLQPHKVPFAHDHAPVATLEEAVRILKPTALIGVAAQAKAFSEPVLRAMADVAERPIVFALSNPTSKAECTSEEAYRWTEGRAVFASGSPAQPVTLHGTDFVPRQANNVYIFPGLGLGVMATQAREVTEAMFLAAAKALAMELAESELAQGSLFPPLDTIRDVSVAIAVAVAKVAIRDGLATELPPGELEPWIRGQMWEPVYTEI